tara:strand:+ start:3412 stop:4206 length:795 start_codon:yes stop_codon:yes gene_type:complete
LEFLQTIALALIQGITEFLPISSSAHLLLPHHVLGWPDQGLAFDTAVHLGSLVAVVTYFRHDIYQLLSAVLSALKNQEQTDDSRFACFLVIASLPVLFVGFFGRFWIEANFRALNVIIIATILFALVLLAADLMGRRNRTQRELDLPAALLIGISQCIALVPGASRSGVTMTMALFLGFTREAASRISFLIAIPAIAGASFLQTIDLIDSGTTVNWASMATGGVIAGGAAFACIKLFLGLIDRVGFLPFILYRLLLGAALFLLI